MNVSSAKACRNQKDIESKLNDALYKNVYTLALIFPTAVTKDFRAVFKKDMFLKNNKAAFINVIYFLLQTLDPVLVKQKITMWPIFDTRTEAQFRTEVLKYVNEINTLPQFADLNIQLPNILMSHLISAGGFRFLKFMLKLSNFVLAKHVHADTDLKKCALLPIIANENITLTKIFVNDRQIITKNILNETNKQLLAQQEYFIKCKEEAKKLTEKQTEIEKSIAEITDKIKKEKTEQTDTSLKLLFENLHEKLDLVVNITKKLQDINMFLSELAVGNKCLEHDKKDFCIPTDVAHILEANNDLDMLKFFEAFTIFINNNMLDLPYFSDSVIKSNIVMMTKENDHLKVYNKQLQQLCLKFANMNAKIKSLS